MVIETMRNKKIFNIEDYASEKVVMHCDTEEKAKVFCNYLDKLRKYWQSGDRYSKYTFWEHYTTNTCYNFVRGTHSDLSNFQMKGYMILEFDDFIFDDEICNSETHNIVQVRLLEDKNAKRYTFNVPESCKLSKGDLIKVRKKSGKEKIGICVTDSEEVSENCIDMIMSGGKVLSDVVGIYKYEDLRDF